jgi:acetolactate synthase-1/2/3 large subunit
VDAGVRNPRADAEGVTTPTETTAAQFVIESVKRAGIDVVFGLPGVHALGLFNAVEKSSLRYVGLRHEQAAAHAADGYGRATGKPGVVLLSTGPGALNSLSAIGEAYVSSSPVLALTSAIPTYLQNESKGFLHETKDLAPAFASVTSFSGRARTVDEIPGLLENAFATCFATRHGTALVELPLDLIDARLESEPIQVKPPQPPLGADETEKLQEAAKLLGMASRPAIWAGGGVIRSGATAELVRVAEALDAPVITTFMGKGAFPEEHPLAIGCMVRQPETQELLGDADALLAIGTRFTAMATAQWKMELPSQLIHIDADPAQIGRNYPVRLGIAGDAKAALQVLLERLDSPRKRDGTLRAAVARKAAFDRAFQYGPREMAMLNAVRSALDPEIVTVHDMTIPSYWSWPFFPVTEPRTFHTPYGFGSLGFSLPAAIGVAASDPSSPVVAFCGDGGFQYHGRELATIRENSLPVITLVFNDRAWGVLKGFSQARYDSTFGMALPGPDFAMLAEAHGLPASQASEPDELEKRLREAVESEGPALIEVPGDWKLPPPTEYYR